MQKKFFRIVILAGAVFVTSQAINPETAHAFDLGNFVNQHSGKLDGVLGKYDLESLRDKITNKDGKSEQRLTSTSNAPNNKWDVDSLLSNLKLKNVR